MQSYVSRFACPSSSLELAVLLKRMRKAFWISLVLGIAVHLSMTQVTVFEEKRSGIKPLTTKFIKRAPRLTKPLEMKKRPRPKQRQIQRKMVAIKAKVNRRDLASRVQPLQVMRSLAKPHIQMSRSMVFGAVKLEPQTLAEQITGSKESKTVVDMSLEMVDIDALDTGEYQAMVIQDPSDKRNIRGYFHFVVAYSVTMRDIQWHSTDARLTFALKRLVDTMNKHTQIKADIKGRITFDSGELFKTPWVYAAAVFSFNPTESECFNLGKYMVSGGLFFGDTTHHLRYAALKSLWEMIVRAFASQGLQHGKDWTLEKLPQDHAIYHCFFDFTAPPLGADYKWTRGGFNTYTPPRWPGEPGPYRYLEGVTLDGQLVNIYSKKGYGNPWGDWGPGTPAYRMGHGYGLLDATRALQFGVNIIVFALTQEGSITEQVMDSVAY